MGWLSKLFGVKQPARRSSLQTGFHWEVPGVPALAAARGFNQNVSGESFYRPALAKLTGGQTTHGVKVHVTAHLAATTYKDMPAVTVSVDGQRVGSIPAGDAPALSAELLSLDRSGHATAKGKIEAGFEGGDFSVKLSVARPLRVRA